MRPIDEYLARLPSPLRRGVLVLWRAVASMDRHGGVPRATALAFYGFLSIFPTAVLAASIAGIWLPRSEVMQWLGEQLHRALLPYAAEIVERAVSTALEARGAVTLVAVVGLLYSASGFFAGLAGTLDAVWQGPSRRFFLWTRVLAAGLTAVTVVLAAVSAAVTSVALNFWPYVLGFLGLDPQGPIREVGSVLLALLSLGTDIVLGALLYRFLPSRRPPWRAAWLAGCVNGVGWNVLKIGFSAYLDHFARYGLVYGTLSSVIGVLIWAQFASVVFVFAAELSAVVCRHPDPEWGR